MQAVWAVPTHLREALSGVLSRSHASRAARAFRLPEAEEWLARWRELLPTFLLLLFSVLLPAVGMYLWRAVPVLPASATNPQVQFFMQAPQPLSDEGYWAVEVDGEVVARFPAERQPLWVSVPLSPQKPHRVRFLWQNTHPVVRIALWEDTVTLAEEEVWSVDPGLGYPHHQRWGPSLGADR